MSLALLDARQWQQTVDLRSGHPVEAAGPTVDMVRGLLTRHPFPGDRDPLGNAWVVDTALDLIAHYDPSFAFLTLARQYYSARYSHLKPGERQDMVTAAFAEADRFARESGFQTVLVGTGDMTPVVAGMEISDLDGLGLASNWSTRYAGVYGMTPRDREHLESLPGLERLASRQDIVRLFGGTPGDGARLPDFMAVAKAGYYFKGNSLRRLIMLPECSSHIPVAGSVEGVDSIVDIKDRVLGLLGAGTKTAIILLEGIGCEDFDRPFTACRNGEDWYRYEPGDAQYLSLTTGKHAAFSHNGGYRYYLDDSEHKQYPFSGYFKDMPTGTIGEDYPGRSIAVGNRSMFMHMTTGCDIAYECFARNLYNQGCMAVIHRQDK